MQILIMVITALALGSNNVCASDDLAFDRLAQKLELIRNQIELTIENHQAVESDVRRQNMELKGFEVFTRVPLASQDLKDDQALLKSIRKDFEQAAAVQSGFRIHAVKFLTKWNAARHKVPKSVPFDIGYQAPENQIVDSRDLQLEVEFEKEIPKDFAGWLGQQQSHVRRLFTPTDTRHWQRKGKRLTARARIYRFRDFEYPKLTAPNLARYKVSHKPTTQSQTASVQRILRYRKQIAELWPQAQAHLDNLRAFALNDLRMSFFSKHAKPHSH